MQKPCQDGRAFALGRCIWTWCWLRCGVVTHSSDSAVGCYRWEAGFPLGPSAGWSWGSRT
jgi:hypothetical protein